jgi:hypothetical protein
MGEIIAAMIEMKKCHPCGQHFWRRKGTIYVKS